MRMVQVSSCMGGGVRAIFMSERAECHHDRATYNPERAEFTYDRAQSTFCSLRTI